jgi:3-deoxy-manno-octulosonate cytidylyltransferase (CMP-KDO synthetase)
MKRIIVILLATPHTFTGETTHRHWGKPLLQWVYEGACKTKLADRVLIATDDERIKMRLWLRCRGCHDRPSSPKRNRQVFAAIRDSEADLIINLQGDEPFIEPSIIDQLLLAIEEGGVEMATLCCPITEENEYRDPNTVKVVLESSGFALYFPDPPSPFQKLSTQNSEL